MNESGVLGRFVPDFGKIVALMQFNMYHHYTVDEHLIRAVGVMAEIANGGLRERAAADATSCCRTLNDRGCSMWRCSCTTSPRAGRRITRSPAPASRASSARASASTPAETETVAWLVEHHLLMSEIAQARDLQDPETATAFADVVQSPQRLALLMILTVCDIRAVGPGVWNGWKGSAAALALLRDRAAALGRPLARSRQRDRIDAAKAELARGARRLAEPTRSRPISAATTTTTGCASSPSCRSSMPRMIRDADQAGQPLRRLDPGQGLRGHHRGHRSTRPTIRGCCR